MVKSGVLVYCKSNMIVHVASPHILDNKVYTKINILIRAYDVIAPQNYYACGTHTCMDMLMHACD